jgi:AcrR family transcriptional regulator
MALPFTPEQMNDIRQRLLKSAQRHARDTGLKKTSLDMLTADAGISKSSFYKFYESKELLFLEVSMNWEKEILEAASATLEHTRGKSNRERAAAFVYAVFETIHRMGIVRFLREDLPLLGAFIPQGSARAHCMDSAESIFARLQEEKIRFTAPDETVLSVIKLMYLSILSIHDIGENFWQALYVLVDSACAKLVA